PTTDGRCPQESSETKDPTSRSAPSSSGPRPGRPRPRPDTREIEAMALTKPTLTRVNPGEPVTAQGWNTILDGVGDLFDAVLAFGHGVLEVSVLHNGNAVLGAQVVAVPATGDLTPIAAVPLYGTVTTYSILGVTAGQWHVFVSAPG